MSKTIKGMEKIVLKYLYDKPHKIAKEIYAKRKEFNLYTLSDIEIDEERVRILLYTFQGDGAWLHHNDPKDLANRIAKEKPIRVVK